MVPRTIDNLGIETSTRYAQDQKNLDENMIREAKGISGQTEIEALTTSFSSEVELLFGLEKRNITWATFFAPPRYSDQKRRLFSHHIIPELGTEEQKEAQIVKIGSLVMKEDVFEKKLEAQDKEEGRSKQQRAWEKKREKEEEEKEKKILLSLLNSISDLDKFLADINSRRTQYQRG